MKRIPFIEILVLVSISLGIIYNIYNVRRHETPKPQPPQQIEVIQPAPTDCPHPDCKG